MVNDVSKIINKTAEVLEYSPEVVKHVVKHQFSDLRSFMLKPTSVVYRMQHLGEWKGNMPSLNSYLKELINKLRVDKSYQEQFTIFWKYRRDLQKEDQRRKFKERFGSWHWKKKDE